jgi:hypothetical protein
MPNVGVIVIPDTIRPSAVLRTNVVVSGHPPPVTEMTMGELERMIDGLHALAKTNCVRADDGEHDCVTVDTRSHDDDSSIWVTVVFARQCLYDSHDESIFMQDILNLMNQRRVASHSITQI